MPPLIVLALIIGSPILLIYFLRANAAIVFLALCAGSVLVQFLNRDAINLFNSLIPSTNTVNESIMELALLYVPALLTILFMSKSVSGAKSLMNLGPAVATGVVGALMAVPLLPGGIQHNIISTEAWPMLQQYQSAIVGAAVLVSLLSLWFGYPKNSHGRGKKHK